PKDTETRVVEALDKVRPYLGSHAGGVELLGVDPEGVVHLRLEGSCDGCPSSTMTVKLAIERAIEEAAPEVIAVEAENLTAEREPQLLQIRTMRPEWQEPCPAVETGGGGGGLGWGGSWGPHRDRRAGPAPPPDRDDAPRVAGAMPGGRDGGERVSSGLRRFVGPQPEPPPVPGAGREKPRAAPGRACEVAAPP